MSHSVTLNGTTHQIPDPGDFESTGWGANVTGFFDAIPAGVLQKTGGAFTLTAETNFGASFGLAAVSYKSVTANPATAGTLRLGKTDYVDWRNNANSANLPLAINGSDRLTFNGIELVDLSSPQTLTNKTISGLVLAGFTADKAVVSDGAGILTTSNVSATEIGRLSNVTSNIQLQFNALTNSINAHLADVANPHSVTKTQLGLSNVLNTKVNTAVVPPTVNEDSGDGYTVGSRWIDTALDKEYVLTDATPGAAVWQETTLTTFSPGGATTQVQFNDGGIFGGDSGFTYNKSTDTASIGNLLLANALPISQGGTGATSAGGARSNLQLVIGTDVQAQDPTLQSLSGYNTNGILVQTAMDTFAGRSVVGSPGILVQNGTGVAGNIIVSQIADTFVQRIEVVKNSGAVVATRKQLNFIDGDIGFTIVDDPVNNQVDITAAINIPVDTAVFVAGEALGGHRVVVIVGAGEAVYADHTNVSHADIVLGITTGAASVGADVTVQTANAMTEGSWNWTLGQEVFLSTAGQLTQTPPTSGFVIGVGFPLDSNTLQVRIEPPIRL